MENRKPSIFLERAYLTGSAVNVAFGGHVMAQAAQAASEGSHDALVGSIVKASALAILAIGSAYIAGRFSEEPDVIINVKGPK